MLRTRRGSLKTTLEHMFGGVRKSCAGEDVTVAVHAATGRPAGFGCGHTVTAVHGHWREWSVAGADIECWRVESDTGLVVVLAHDLDRGRWYVARVWD